MTLGGALAAIVVCDECGSRLAACRCAPMVKALVPVAVLHRQAPEVIPMATGAMFGKAIAFLDAMSLFKGIVKVKEHQRQTKNGAITVHAHERNVLTIRERKDLARNLAEHIAAGKGARVAKASHAHAIARHIAKTTGRAVHVTEHPKGGFSLSHKAPGKNHQGAHITVRAEKTIVHHPEHGAMAVSHKQATAALNGKPVEKPQTAQRKAAPEPATPEQAAKEHGLPAGAKLYGEHDGALEVTIPADKILTDARAYQFKEGGDEYGVTGRLKDVKNWDSITGLTNVVMLHQTKDGKVYVVDGHQRTGLARRLLAEGKQVPPLRAIVFREADGYSQERMRRIGALMNIRQGTGTAIDIAKVLRDSELSDEERNTIPAQSNEMYQDGEALATLSDEAFEELNAAPISHDDKKNAAFGAIVAREIKDKDKQSKVIGILRKNAPRGKEECMDQVMALKLAGFDKVKTDQLSFFHMDDTLSLIKPFSEIMGSLRRDLNSDRSALGNAIRNRARLESRGNKVNAEQSKQGVEEADALQQFLEKTRYAGVAGEFNATMQDLARKLHRGEIKKHEAVTAAQQALESAFKKVNESGEHSSGDQLDGEGAERSGDVRGEGNEIEETDEEREDRRRRESMKAAQAFMGGGLFGAQPEAAAAKSLALLDEVRGYMQAIPQQHRMADVLHKAMTVAMDRLPRPDERILSFGDLGAGLMDWGIRDTACKALGDAAGTRGGEVLGDSLAACAGKVAEMVGNPSAYPDIAKALTAIARMNAHGGAVMLGYMNQDQVTADRVSVYLQAHGDSLGVLAALYPVEA